MFDEEHATQNTAWIKALAKGVRSHLPGDARKIFKKNNQPTSDDYLITSLAVMLVDWLKF